MGIMSKRIQYLSLDELVCESRICARDSNGTKGRLGFGLTLWLIELGKARHVASPSAAFSAAATRAAASSPEPAISAATLPLAHMPRSPHLITDPSPLTRVGSVRAASATQRRTSESETEAPVRIRSVPGGAPRSSSRTASLSGLLPQHTSASSMTTARNAERSRNPAASPWV
eukprot:scaffold1975_cov29-Tisochrysis_lutea.AAC.3